MFPAPRRRCRLRPFAIIVGLLLLVALPEPTVLADTPTGDWSIAVRGHIEGNGFLSFTGDGAITGRILIRPNPMADNPSFDTVGFFLLDGTWALDSHGRIRASRTGTTQAECGDTGTAGPAGWTVNHTGGYPAGTTAIVIGSGTNDPIAGDMFQIFKGTSPADLRSTLTFTVTTFDATTSDLTFAPALDVAIEDGDILTFAGGGGATLEISDLLGTATPTHLKLVGASDGFPVRINGEPLAAASANLSGTWQMTSVQDKTRSFSTMTLTPSPTLGDNVFEIDGSSNGSTFVGC